MLFKQNLFRKQQITINSLVTVYWELMTRVYYNVTIKQINLLLMTFTDDLYSRMCSSYVFCVDELEIAQVKTVASL